DVRLSYRFGAGVSPVMGDGTQLRQIVMNLITNASEACLGKGGDVVVATFEVEVGSGDVVDIGSHEPLPAGRYVLLQVEDTGCGMDAATLARVFDPFFTTKMTGRGLGLAAVLGIVRGHHGVMRVYSRPGKGTTFKILFPVTENVVAPARTSARQLPGKDQLILVVDDESVIRRTAK